MSKHNEYPNYYAMVERVPEGKKATYSKLVSGEKAFRLVKRMHKSLMQGRVLSRTFKLRELA